MTRQPAGALICLLVLVGAAYAVALPGPFHFDDYATVAVDPGAQSLAAWWGDARRHVRPLLKASFALTHGLGERLGNVPLGHRLANVLVHMVTVLALFALGRRVAATCLPDLDERAAARAALAAGALLGLHPLATEAVSYISGRSMALGTLAAVASLLAYIRARTGGHQARWLGAAVAACAAALFIRETAIVTSLLWLLWEWARHDRDTPPFSAQRLRQLGRLLAWPAAIAGAFGLWLTLHDRYAYLLEFSWRIARSRPAEPSLIVALQYFISGFALLRYPSIDAQVAPELLSPGARIVGAALVAGVVYTAWRCRNTRPHMLFGVAWLLIWLLPLYLFRVRRDPVAERHFYPAIWGAAFPLAVEWAKWTLRPGFRRVLANGLAAVAATVLLAVTLVRNADYRSEVALWEAAARGAPDKLRVLNNLGVAYMEAGRWEDAEHVLARAVELDPGHERARINLEAARRRELDPPQGVCMPR